MSLNQSIISDFSENYRWSQRTKIKYKLHRELDKFQNFRSPTRETFGLREIPRIGHWINKRATSCENGTYHTGKQWRVRPACTFAQSHQSLLCSLTQHKELQEATDKEPEISPQCMDAHVCLEDHKIHDAKVLFLTKHLQEFPGLCILSKHFLSV